jgi:hypothetical protein
MAVVRADAARGSAELLGELVQELAVLLRSELEVSRLQHAAERRERAYELAALAGGAAAALLALGAATWSAVHALDSVVSTWFAALLVAAGWGAGAAVLLRIGRVPKLVHRLSGEVEAGAVETAERRRLSAERQVRETARELAAAGAVEAVESVASRVEVAVAREREALVHDVIGVLLFPGRLGLRALERIAAR